MSMKINPEVDAIIKPIIYDMTRVDIAQQTNPILNPSNEPEHIKLAKRQCVHITYDGSDYKLRAEKTSEGKLICRVCGREICQVFDKSSIDTLLEARKIVDQVLFFGLINGLKAEPVATLISMKKAIPGVAQLASELYEFVKRDNTNGDSERGLTQEYQTPGGFRSITNMT